jgi:hypothetical protein
VNDDEGYRKLLRATTVTETDVLEISVYIVRSKLKNNSMRYSHYWRLRGIRMRNEDIFGEIRKSCSVAAVEVL